VWLISVQHKSIPSAGTLLTEKWSLFAVRQGVAVPISSFPILRVYSMLCRSVRNLGIILQYHYRASGSIIRCERIFLPRYWDNEGRRQFIALCVPINEPDRAILESGRIHQELTLEATSIGGYVEWHQSKDPSRCVAVFHWVSWWNMPVRYKNIWSSGKKLLNLWGVNATYIFTSQNIWEIGSW